LGSGGARGYESRVFLGTWIREGWGNDHMHIMDTVSSQRCRAPVRARALGGVPGSAGGRGACGRGEVGLGRGAWPL
jgi:hypothetical protein